ncbi:MAG: hypothetical protein L0H64_00085, partial [Pseudonocardia sp.]|nr:hypothetical protein [Pseudonocardia sp.]
PPPARASQLGPNELASRVTNLGLKPFDRRCVTGRGPGRLAGIDAGLLDPATQGVGHDPDPRTDPFDRRVRRQRRILRHRFRDQTLRTLTQIVGVLPGSWY